MAEFRFYHLERSNLDQVLPQLLTKALSGGHRILIKTVNDAEAERLSTHLWTFDPNSFLPHGTQKDGHKTDQPVWITANNDNPNNSDVLILTHGQSAPEEHSFTLICDMFDGRAPEMLDAARARWKALKDTDAELSYWQQSPEGRWEKKA